MDYDVKPNDVKGLDKFVQHLSNNNYEYFKTDRIKNMILETWNV